MNEVMVFSTVADEEWVQLALPRLERMVERGYVVRVVHGQVKVDKRGKPAYNQGSRGRGEEVSTEDA